MEINIENIYKKPKKTLFAFIVGFGVDEQSAPGRPWIYSPIF